jgi:Sec-independent protein translocase protein TatA
MGKYLDKFKQGVKKVDKKFSNLNSDNQEEEDYFNDDNFEDERYRVNNDDYDDPFFDEVGSPKSQKPESFHHFILDNQYRDLERSIRGFKDVWNKDTKEWVTVRKKEHCFTDEESEEILRTAQSHLATDIKLGFISLNSYPLLMDAIYQEVAFLFESIAEYRYGRYGSYEKQYEMKLQNHKIFLELFTRIQMNYSRAIQGKENVLTHDSVKGQESLQNTDRDRFEKRRYS